MTLNAVNHWMRGSGWEVARSKQQMDKLLDAYQEDLLTLSDLRQRMPELKKKIATQEKELQTLQMRAIEDQRWTELTNSLESFLDHLNQFAKTLSAAERQKVLRLVVNQIDVGQETITIHHCIPFIPEAGTEKSSSYLVCTRRHDATLRSAIFGRKQFTLFQLTSFKPFSEDLLVRRDMLHKPVMANLVPFGRRLVERGKARFDFSRMVHDFS